MLSIARALLLNPQLLILDEPSQGLAPLIVREVFRIVAADAREGISVLLVEQNARMSLEIADDAYVLDDGIIVYSGPPPNSPPTKAASRRLPAPARKSGRWGEFLRHGRARPGHPRLPYLMRFKTWMPGTSPGMTNSNYERAPHARYALFPVPR